MSDLVERLQAENAQLLESFRRANDIILRKDDEIQRIRTIVVKAIYHSELMERNGHQGVWIPYADFRAMGGARKEFSHAKETEASES